MSHQLLEVYDRLYESFGSQQWWPADSPLEVMVGAILVQNTAWKNVERAITNLRNENLFDAQALYDLPVPELEELLQPAGYFRIKTKRLRNLLQLLLDEYSGKVDTMFATEFGQLRKRLLDVNGIGPETADSILLYAGGLPAFVVDTYTHRVLARHGWIGYEAGYYDIQQEFEDALPVDVKLYNEYHALLVRVGHEFCRKTPKCNDCPLVDMLPDGVVVQPI